MSGGRERRSGKDPPLVIVDDDMNSDGKTTSDTHINQPINSKSIVSDSESNDKVQRKNNNDNVNRHRRLPIDISNRFRNCDTGPYHIFVEHLELNIGRLHPMKLGEKLVNLGEYEKFISEISTVGRNRIKIELTSGSIANKLVEDAFFKKNNLIAYIPSHLTEKRGIVRYVDTSLGEDTLMKIINSPVPNKKVQRMTRLIQKEDTSVRVPRQMIIVTFVGKVIPQYIVINKVRCPVDVYVNPVMQCFRSLRYGHSAS